MAFEIPNARRLLQQEAKYAKSIDRSIASSPRPVLTKQSFLRIVRNGAPLAVVALMLAYTISIPRYVVRDSFGDVELGIFVALFTLTNAQALLTVSVSQSMSPRLALLFVQGNRRRFSLLVSLGTLLALGVGLIGLVIGIAFGRPLLNAIYGPEYANSVAAFNVLVIAGAVLAANNIVGTAVTSMRRFYAQVPVHLAKLALLYVGSVVGAAHAGLEGVAWAIVASTVFGILCNVVLVGLGLAARGSVATEPQEHVGSH